jgi:hypothetical protein
VHPATAGRLSVRAPRITTRGEVEPALVMGLGGGEHQDGMTAVEAREAAAALEHYAAQADRATEVVAPHLRTAVEAAALL